MGAGRLRAAGEKQGSQAQYDSEGHAEYEIIHKSTCQQGLVDRVSH